MTRTLYKQYILLIIPDTYYQNILLIFEEIFGEQGLPKYFTNQELAFWEERY